MLLYCYLYHLIIIFIANFNITFIHIYINNCRKFCITFRTSYVIFFRVLTIYYVICQVIRNRNVLYNLLNITSAFRTIKLNTDCVYIGVKTFHNF